MILMRLQQTQICIFERYSLTLPETLVCHQDGLPGRRSVFITDREESFLVTYEEGMSQMDPFSHLMEEKTAKAIGICGSKFIFQRRVTPKSLYTLFDIEMHDEKGERWILPGQIVVPHGYQWAQGIEPVLMTITAGLDLCNMKRQ